jgi:acyl carrier protein
MKDELLDLILRVADDQNATSSRRIDTQKKADAGLYGSGSPLDSLALVRFIVEIETAVEERFGVPVVLADDRALSQKQSPFRTIGSLAAYIEARVTELNPPESA